MVRTAGYQETRETLKGKLIDVYTYLIQKNESERAGKIAQLAIKLEKGEFTIAFCGHFSAGKSTMINQVLGENLLPSSPIPTSANLVTVKSGEDYAKVFFKREKPRLYTAPYDYELVKNYCKDGDQIHSIEISYSKSNLPENTIIMDTPGIDSADDAHRIATESAIHLADLVFYVMDYNHVQAELNFLFTKELTEAGKDVYLVINQIDKHREDEISFTEFQASTLASFASWGVKPARIFYTSMKKKDLLYNDFPELQRFIVEKVKKKDSSLVDSVFHSMKKITQDYLSEKEDKEREKLEFVREMLQSLSEEEQNAVSENFLRAKSEWEGSRTGLDEAKNSFDQEISKILNNAYLMPYETRALAEAYLEARQPEFKAGILFAKKKTEAERESRLDRFYQEIQAKTKSQLEWHIREYWLKFLKQMEIENSRLLEDIQAFTVSFPNGLLVNTVKQGAGLTGAYILQYCDDVVNEIKKLAREQMSSLKSFLFKELEESFKKRTARLEGKFKETERYFLAYQKIEAAETELQAEHQQIEELLKRSVHWTEDDYRQIFKENPEEVEVISSVGGLKKDNERINNVVRKGKKTLSASINTNQHSANRLHDVSENLDLTANLIHDLPGFNKIANELAGKAKRLQHKGFTVALFGAFSAGKSSFANALIGKKVLPVSPNPTTAAINKIMPVTEANAHGTVLVKFKNAASMLEDVNHSLKMFGLQASSLMEAVKVIDRDLTSFREAEGVKKTHFSFLQAFKKGSSTFVDCLGTVYETNLAEFSEFVANEEKSCFVESIELYYDCDLTKKGITLVDTPGADSINARHTGVAFDYIKNADAILFVTYYNHAFSKADREFLIQLGRVKESFQLDKMFFIINAIDLAEHEEEKETVIDYVEGQLLAYGIRNAYLFAVSSLEALARKADRAADLKSGIPLFESAFYSFIEKDLTSMAVSTSEAELSRVSRMLEQLILSAEEDEASKQQQRLKIESEKIEVAHLLDGQSIGTLQASLISEAEELLYYVKQRVFYRFDDFFKESFNPSVIKEDGRNIKRVLQEALDELLESIGFDFAQEMRATTVRLDRYIEKILMDFQTMIVRSLAEINHDLSFAPFEFKNADQLSFKTAFQELDRRIFARALAYFKNLKSFFEKNEKKKMSEAIHEGLNEPADQFLKFQFERLKEYYQAILERESARLLAELRQQASDYHLSLLSTLDGGVPIERLISTKQSLAEINKNLGKGGD